MIEQTYWNVNLTGMIQAGQPMIDTPGYKAAIDSGTSLIVGADTLINPLIANITVNEDCSGVESLPDITLYFDG